MVLKEEICTWFREARCSERIDLVCSLLQMCLPLELRFLGSCVEDLAKKDYVQLREYEIKANDSSHVRNLNTPSTFFHSTISKLNLYMALMNSLNTVCAHVMYEILTQIEPRLCAPSGLPCPQLDSVIAEDIILLFTMAAHHPAFTFCERQQLYKVFISIKRLLSEGGYFSKTCSQGCEENKNICNSTNTACCSTSLSPSDIITGGSMNRLQHVSTSSSGSLPMQPSLSTPSDSNSVSNTLTKTSVFVKDVGLRGCTGHVTGQSRRQYQLQVTWSDGETSEITKTPHEVHKFHTDLLRFFPKESGAHKLERAIPFLPPEKGNLNSSAHQDGIRNYFRSIASTPSHIAHSEYVTAFFCPSYEAVNRNSDMSRRDSCGGHHRTKRWSPHNSPDASRSPQHSIETSSHALCKPSIVTTTSCSSLHRGGMTSSSSSSSPSSSIVSPANSPRISNSPAPRLNRTSSPRPATGPLVSSRRGSPNMTTIDQWLKHVRLHKYMDTLRQFCTWEELFKLKEKDLVDAGLTAGARKKFFSEINKIKEGSNGLVVVDVPVALTTQSSSSPDPSDLRVSAHHPHIAPPISAHAPPTPAHALPFLHHLPSYPPTFFMNPNHHFPSSPAPPVHLFPGALPLQQSHLVPGTLDTVDSSSSDVSSPPPSPSSELIVQMDSAGCQTSPSRSATCSDGDDETDKDNGAASGATYVHIKYTSSPVPRLKPSGSVEGNSESTASNNSVQQQQQQQPGGMSCEAYKAGMMASPPPLPVPPHMTHFRPNPPFIRPHHPGAIIPQVRSQNLMLRPPQMLPPHGSSNHDNTSPQPASFNGGVSSHCDEAPAVNQTKMLSVSGSTTSTETVASYKAPIGFPPQAQPRPASLGIGHDVTSPTIPSPMPLAVTHPVPVTMTLPTHMVEMTVSSHHTVTVSSNSYYPVTGSPSTAQSAASVTSATSLTPSPSTGSATSPSPPSSTPVASSPACSACPHVAVPFTVGSVTWPQYPHLYPNFMGSPGLNPPNGLISPSLPYSHHHPPPLTPFSIPNGLAPEIVFNNQANFVMQQQRQGGGSNSGGAGILGQHPMAMTGAGHYHPPPPSGPGLLVGPPLHQASGSTNSYNKSDKSPMCCNCGATGHSKVQCKEATFDMITRSGHYHLNMAPKTEAE